MIKYIQTAELEQMARRVWNAKLDKSTKYADGSKCVSFEVLGYQSRSTEFPMRSGEWTEAGRFEMKISYPKWDIPGYIYVRQAVKQALCFRIEAIAVRCPDCEGPCVNESGSQLIENRTGDQSVTCLNCRRRCTVPASVFQIR